MFRIVAFAFVFAICMTVGETVVLSHGVTSAPAMTVERTA
jgi:hypothetical protein